MTPTGHLRWFSTYKVHYESVLQQWWGVVEEGRALPPESNRGEWRTIQKVMEFKP